MHLCSNLMKTLQDFQFNGFEALQSVLIQTYGGVPQALARLTLFAHPETVAQTQNKALFPVVRATTVRDRGKLVPERQVMLCDNTSAQDAFLWTHSMQYGQFKDVQFNHIYSVNDPRYYTSLANLCVTPTFLAKLTDTHQDSKKLLQYRAWDIYKFVPDGYPVPERPVGYDQLDWAPFMPVETNVAERIRQRLLKRVKSRAAIAATNFGWLFDALQVQGHTRSNQSAA